MNKTDNINKSGGIAQSIKNAVKKCFGTPKGNLIFGAAVLLLYLLVSAIFTVFDLHITGMTSPCVFYTQTGFLCPGCGGTRCVDSLLHFRYADSLIFNPMTAIVFAAVCTLCIFSIVNAIRRPYRPIKYKFRTWHVILFASLFLFFFLIRNIYWFKING